MRRLPRSRPWTNIPEANPKLRAAPYHFIEDPMKLLYFNDFRLGVLKGDAVVDVTPVVQKIPHNGPGDLMNRLIERSAEYRGPLERAVADGRGVPVAQVKIRPPLPKP